MKSEIHFIIHAMLALVDGLMQTVLSFSAADKAVKSLQFGILVTSVEVGKGLFLSQVSLTGILELHTWQ